MAVITGYTAERMKAIEDTTVTSGSVNGSGSLILAQRGGAQIDAGNVKGPQGLQGIQGIQGIQGPQGLQAPAPPWTANTVYSAGTWIVSPFGEIVKSKSSRTSGASWTSAEAVNWAGRDQMMSFSNNGFAWAANSNWDAGPLSLDASAGASSQTTPSLSPGFAAPGTLSGSIKFLELGLYDVIWDIAPGMDVGNAGYRINSSTGAWPGPIDFSNGIFGQNVHLSGQSFWETKVVAAGIRIPVVDLEIRFVGSQSVASTNVPRIRVIKRSSI